MAPKTPIPDHANRIRMLLVGSVLLLVAASLTAPYRPLPPSSTCPRNEGFGCISNPLLIPEIVFYSAAVLLLIIALLFAIGEESPNPLTRRW